MKIELLIEKVEGMRKYTENLINKVGRFDLYKDDLLTLHEISKVLTALHHNGIADTDGITRFFERLDEVQRQDIVVIAKSATETKCLGTFADLEKATGAAFIWLDEKAEKLIQQAGNHAIPMITATEKLPDNNGYKLYLMVSGAKTHKVVILGVPQRNED